MSALATLPPPERSFASDNTAGAHPDVVAAVLAANTGHVAPYGEDLAAQYAAALEGGRILAWAAAANDAAARLATRLRALPGVALAYPVETNAVFCRLPAGVEAVL